MSKYLKLLIAYLVVLDRNLIDSDDMLWHVIGLSYEQPYIPRFLDL